MEPRPNYLVLRRFLDPSKCRYYPYATGRGGSCKEATKDEVVRLGVELSVYVAESMFCLCDDIRTMLWFCFKLWRCVIEDYQNPVSERLLHVIHYVYSKHIKPNNGVCDEHDCESVQWELIKNTWNDFAEGILVFHRLESILRKKDCSFDDRLLSSAIAKYKQVLKKLEDKLRSAKHVSEANGFAREMIESNISSLWKSFFDEEEAIPKVILSDLFEPFLSKPKHREILALPLSSPYILGEDFAMQELKEEVMQLGVELSLLVAQSMFSLCDNIRSVLNFCYVLYRDVKRGRNHASPVVERLLRVIYYVYLKDIKPMNQNAGKSVQWGLISTTLENFVVGFRNLDRLVSHVRAEEGRLCREYTSGIEVELNKVEEKLRCAEANGFAREALKSNILDLWKSVYDKKAKEARPTLKEITTGIILDMFLPICHQGAPPPP